MMMEEEEAQQPKEGEEGGEGKSTSMALNKMLNFNQIIIQTTK